LGHTLRSAEDGRFRKVSPFSTGYSNMRLRN